MKRFAKWIAMLAGAAALGGCALDMPRQAEAPADHYELYPVTLQNAVDRSSGEDYQGGSVEHGMIFKLDTRTGKTWFAPFGEESHAMEWKEIK